FHTYICHLPFLEVEHRICNGKKTVLGFHHFPNRRTQQCLAAHDVTSQLQNSNLQTKSLYITSNTWDRIRQEVLCYHSIHICRQQNQATYVKHLNSLGLFLDIAMESKTYWLFVAGLCLTFFCPQSEGRPPYACQCLMDVKERKNCDFASKGITAEECTANGCCFDSTVPDVPWCFKPSGERVSLRYAKKMIEPEARMHCGYEGISRKRCKRIGCCFDPTVSGASMCFHPPVNNGHAKMCGMAPKKRVPCGYPGISADECLGKGCCYEHYQYSQKVPWCFEPSEKQDNFSV
ncbi:hypothetical protein JD844_032637, partial [Phrynosoma platyrhinos]